MHAVDPEGAIEYDCVDCDLHVISIAPPHDRGQKCAGCRWLAELPGNVDREALRVHLAECGTIGRPRVTPLPSPP